MGTFLFDRQGRHIWSFDCVKPILTATGACLGLERSNQKSCLPPPVTASLDTPDVLTWKAAWESGAWDATWMCLECAAGLYRHDPLWLAQATSADFAPSSANGPAQAPVGQRRPRDTAARRGGRKRKSTQ